MKGIVFIMVYTLLILFTFFSKPWSLINTLGIPTLFLIWIVGMLDAYIYMDNIDEEESSLQLARPILVGAVISISFIMLGAFMIRDRPENKIIAISSEFAVSNVDINPDLPNTDILVSKRETSEQVDQQYSDIPVQQVFESENPLIQPNIERDANSKTYISIQVGAFANQSEANSLADRLKKKGYSVNVLFPEPNESLKLYKVRVGKFQKEANALRIAQILNRDEEIPTLLVSITE